MSRRGVLELTDEGRGDGLELDDLRKKKKRTPKVRGDILRERRKDTTHLLTFDRSLRISQQSLNLLDALPFQSSSLNLAGLDHTFLVLDHHGEVLNEGLTKERSDLGGIGRGDVL